MARHNETGKRGEAIARRYLEEQGCRILEENWRYRRAEVDLIAMEGPVLLFVEVKARSSAAFGEPEDFVTRQKEALLAAAAHAYIDQIDHEEEIRFDIVSILFREGQSYRLKHLKDAFFPGL